MTSQPCSTRAQSFAGGKKAAYPSSPMMMATDPDHELVRLAQTGDAVAFEALVVKYQRRIAGHVARYVKRASDVEEVVQDVFMKVYRGIGAFKGDSAFYTWVYRISRNAALNFVTRQSKTIVLQDDIAPSGDLSMDTYGSDNENPERALVARQIAEVVQRAMQQLDPELAEPLVLFEVEGKQYKEIAQMLQIPIGTVRTRIFRAREFIAQRLEPVIGPMRDRRW